MSDDAFSAWSWPDYWLLFQAWVLLLLTDLSLRVLPFGRVQALLAPGRNSPRADDATAEVGTIEHSLRVVSVAAQHHLYAMRCLRRALVLQWLLGRRGIKTDLRIGVRKEEGCYSAHAWLERDGQPIGEPADIAARFLPLVRPQSARLQRL